MKEAIKCLVNESPGRLPPLPAGPGLLTFYRGWFMQEQGSVTGAGLGGGGPGIPRGIRHPSGHRHPMGVRGGQTPPWCLLTLGRQTWLVASCEEEEEEGCRRSDMDLSMLGLWSGDPSHLLGQVPASPCTSPALTIPANPSPASLKLVPDGMWYFGDIRR